MGAEIDSGQPSNGWTIYISWLLRSECLRQTNKNNRRSVVWLGCDVLDAVKDEENPWNNTYMVQARIGASLVA